MIGNWFKKQPAVCTEEDVTFLFLLCFGRLPLDQDEIAPFLGEKFFASLKLLLGRTETQILLIERLALGKLPPHATFGAPERAALAQGIQKWFHLAAPSPGLNWRDLLEAGINSQRFGRAFLSHFSGDRLEGLRASVALLPKTATPHVKGRILSLSGQSCTGHVIDMAAPGQSMTLDFFLNGVYAGSSQAQIAAHQWAQDYGGHAPFSFEHGLTIPEVLAGENRVSLSVFDQASGAPIVGSRELVLSPQFAVDRVQTLTAELAALRAASAGQKAVLAKLDQLEFMLPGLDQYTTLPLSAYQAYRSLHPQKSPSASAGDHDIQFDILIHGASDRARLDVTRASLEAQTFTAYKQIELTEDASNPARAFISGIAEGSGSHLLFLEAGDCLSPHALAWLAAAITTQPDAMVYLGDHDLRDPVSGEHDRPSFLPPFDYDMLIQRNVHARAFAVARNAVATAGTLDNQASQVFYHDLLLRLHELGGDGAFHHVPQVLWHLAPRPLSPQQLMTQKDQQVASVEGHLARRGLQASVTPHADVFGGPVADALRVRWPLDPSLPKLAIIIPTKDKLELIEPCVRSILETIDHPDRTEIVILDNGSQDPSVCRWFKSVATATNISVIPADQPFNWSALNNLGARATDAPYLLFLNDDTLALDRGWDTQLRRQLNRKAVGAVGARLLYRNGTIQHAGMIFYSLTEARHEGAERHCNAPHPQARTRLAHACAAVTGAFLACRRDIFDALGGFDETFAVINNDVDFCFRVRKAGYRVLYDPQLTFRHFQSASRGTKPSLKKQQRLLAEAMELRKKWRDTFVSDPFYPAVFARSGQPFARLASPPPDATNDS